VRGFTQDGAHIFCTDEKVAAECWKINDLIFLVERGFGFDEVTSNLSTWPDKCFGWDDWGDRAEGGVVGVRETIKKRSKP
ncbi:threonine--tRNA ligase, partial [Rhizobium ruizarguesonis]